MSRPRTAGSIYYEKGRHRWVAVIELGLDQNGKRQRRRLTGQTKRSVEDRLRTEMAKRDAGISILGAQTKLGDWLDKWASDILPSGTKPRSANTIASTRLLVAKHLKPGLGHIRIGELTVEQVEAFLRGKATDGLAKATLVKLRSTLTMAIRQAERRGYVLRNVASLAAIPPAPTHARRSLTVEQANALLESSQGDPIEALIVTGLMLGLRRASSSG